VVDFDDLVTALAPAPYHSHVRHFKQQARKFLACFPSVAAWPPPGMAGGTIMNRRLIML